MKQLKVLIIDDSEVLLSNLKASLSLAGFDVQVTTQTVGIGRLVADRHVVLIDYHMPGVKGGDVAASLRRVVEGRSQRCMLYLYTTDTVVAAQYLSFGFDGVLHHKGDTRSLIDQLSAVNRRRQIGALLSADAERVKA